MISIGRRLASGGYVVANDGNLSCLLESGLVLATPTGVSKGQMTADMLSVLDLDGRIVEQGSIKISSEVLMHLRVYRENPRVGAVVHAHPVTATAFAAAGIPLDDSILTESITAIGSLPVARFAVPGTEQVPESIAPFCARYNGALLANHGVITWGGSLEQAFFRMEWAEQTAKVTLLTKYVIGQYRTLSCEQVEAIVPLRRSLGVDGGGDPLWVPDAQNTQDVLPQCGATSGSDDRPSIPIVEEIVQRVTQRLLTELSAERD